MHTNQPVIHRNLLVEELNFRPEMLQKELLGEAPTDEAMDVFDKVYEDVCQNSRISAGYIALQDSSIRISDETLSVGDILFCVKKIIAHALNGAEQIYVFTASLGDYCETFVREKMAQGDYLQGYLSDGIGSALTEAAAAFIEVQISKRAAVDSHICTMRYSPGYCGWSVAEQHKLFGFFPTGFCGITLTEHAMMLPLKSVSGIIASGKHVRRNEYQCAKCEEKDCLHYDKK